MSRFAIMRLAKVKSIQHIAGLGRHLERTRESGTPNADPERTPLNEHLVGSGNWKTDVESRLQRVKIRSNAVLAVEHLMTTSPEWFRMASDQQRLAWKELSMAWLAETYGEANIAGAILHHDETTDHLHSLVVPIDGKGHLNARFFVGGTRDRMAELQTLYAAKVAPLGLERGVRGSAAQHQDIKRYYARLQEPAREPETWEDIKRRDGHLFTREPDHWHVGYEGPDGEWEYAVRGEDEARAAGEADADRIHEEQWNAWNARGADRDHQPAMIDHWDGGYALLYSDGSGLPDARVWVGSCEDRNCDRPGVRQLEQSLTSPREQTSERNEEVAAAAIERYLEQARRHYGDDPHEPDLDELHHESIIRELGAEYAETPGHYTLMGEQATLEGDRWRIGDRFGAGDVELVAYVTGSTVRDADAWLKERYNPEEMAGYSPTEEPECEVDLERVVIALGGVYHDNYHHRTLGGERVSVEGERWRVGERSGTGAIALVQGTTGYDQREATSWLAHALGPETAVAAATRHAQLVVERDPRPPFRHPERDEREFAWQRVRDRLVEQHSLPVGTVDRLYAEGRLYAGKQGHAVWLHQDEAGQVTGATLEREGLHLAPDSRDGGWFATTTPARQGPGDPRPTLILADTPAEALAVAELHGKLYDGRTGPVTTVAIEDSRRVPEQAIRGALAQGGVVRVAVKDDRVAERIKGQLPEHERGQVTRDQPALENWGAVLRWHRLTMRDPERAALELRAMWRQNAPDERLRASLREAVQRWGPDQSARPTTPRPRQRDGYER